MVLVAIGCVQFGYEIPRRTIARVVAPAAIDLLALVFSLSQRVKAAISNSRTQLP